jgi:hypothetical protein
MNLTLAHAQILQDTAAINMIRTGIRNIYNLQFDEAKKAYIKIKQLYPEHPVLSLYSGMMIYWENFPLLPSSSACVSFEENMHKCIEQCEKGKSPAPGYEAEFLLADLCARGLLLLFYADNDVSNKVMPLAAGTYKYLMRSFRFTSECPDLLYFTGVYNYYRDAYPKVYPIYKTVAFMFPPGEMEKGLKEIEDCAVRSMALSAEAYFILSWIRMNFESNFKEALPYCILLNNQYPSNVLYKVCYIKNLLLLKKYDEAERIIRISGETDKNPFYQAVLRIFNGLIQEKKYQNNVFAQDLYNKGIREISVFGAYGNEYAAYAYFGLSRIGEESEDNHERRMNHRKAMDLVDFKKVNFDE